MSLCFLVVLLLAGCDKKKEDEDSDGTPEGGTAPVAKPTPATPKPGDWMWKGDKPKTDSEKYANPLNVPNNMLDQKKKK